MHLIGLWGELENQKNRGMKTTANFISDIRDKTFTLVRDH